MEKEPIEGPPAARRGHKEALLEGAMTCLHERGFAGTTARDIVAASNTNLASIGYHYGSKDRLMVAALGESSRRWMMPTIARLATVGDQPPWERMRDALAAIFDDLESHRPLVLAYLEAAALAGRNTDVRASMAVLHVEMRGALAASIEAVLGEEAAADAVDPVVIASFLMAAFDGLMVQWVADPDAPASPRELLASFEAAMGVLAPGAPRD
jgi:AcrR family transcriptional regulator